MAAILGTYNSASTHTVYLYTEHTRERTRGRNRKKKRAFPFIIVAFRAMRALCVATLLAAVQPARSPRWAERLTARVGTPTIRPAATSAVSTAELATELRRFVGVEVEPAIALLRAHEESRANTELCFGSDAGLHLRYRCCVYFSTLAGALLEERYSTLAAKPPDLARTTGDIYRCARAPR